jgi:transcriptional regulator with XRE-family HTH domain
VPPSSPTPTALGRVVRALRTERGLSQEAVAHAAGISVPYLSDVERGVRNPSLEILSAVAGALGMALSDLIARAERNG